jgi:4-hydroxy 2-oxovalerate aldolase
MKILDCTLRDGGYYTNWDFPPTLVDTYIGAFNQLPVEYLEIGYRSNPMLKYLGEFFYSPLHVLERLSAQSNKKLVIILNEKDVRAADAEFLLTPCKPYITMIRLAVDPKNFVRALELGKAVKSLGFELSFNVMYMSNWNKHPELMENLHQLEGLADYLYTVDSFGGVYPEDVRQTIRLIRKKTTTPLGFHGHNNLELGLINTLTAIEEGVDIVDATITGMGRGAGNLKMELLLTVLSAKGIVDFDFNALSKVTDSFTALQNDYGWGTNLPYMVSGAHSLPQKQVMSWVTKRFYSFNSILRALSNQSKGLKDNQQLPKINFAGVSNYDTALIVGGGPSAVQHAIGVEELLKRADKPVIIHASSRNAMSYAHLDHDQYFCLVGNEGHRMEEVFHDTAKVEGKCILPPYPRQMGTYIPSNLENQAYELPKVDFTDKLTDTHLSLALQTAKELNFKKVYLIGYDGYPNGTANSREQEVFRENEYLFIKAKEARLECISLAPSIYENLEVESVYSLIS